MARRNLTTKWGGRSMEKLKTKDIPVVKKEILSNQGYACMLCKVDMRKVESRNVCLDHCHRTGYIRGVLCRNCNGVLGRLESLATRAKKGLTHITWLENAVRFLRETSRAPAYEYIHPTFKSPTEKRVLANKRARIRRDKK